MSDSAHERLVCITCGEELGNVDSPWATRTALFLHRSLREAQALLENMNANAARVGTTKRPLPRFQLVGHDRAVRESEFCK